MNHNNPWISESAINTTESSNVIALSVIGTFLSTNSLICPSCLMFDAHKGHAVCRIEEGSKDLRTKINSAAKEGLLKF